MLTADLDRWANEGGFVPPDPDPVDERMFRVIIEDDPAPDLSWLDTSDYEAAPVYASEADMRAGKDPIPAKEYTDPDNHITYGVILEQKCEACGCWHQAASVWGVDFYEPSNDYPSTGMYELWDNRLKDPYIRSLVAYLLAEAQPIGRCA